MRSSRANATIKHVEDVSMYALFLLDVCKTVDGMFGVQCKGTHTTRDADRDIQKIESYLYEEKVTKRIIVRDGLWLTHALMVVKKLLKGCWTHTYMGKRIALLKLGNRTQEKLILTMSYLIRFDVFD